MRWGQYCMMRLSVSYRGRAVPLSGDVLEHASAQVAFRAYRKVRQRAAQ
jgi:hypothetical protein